MAKRTYSAPLRAGLIGCGKISNAYFNGLKPFTDIIQITAVSDIDLERAKAKAQEQNVPKACTVEELLKDPDIDIVLNLTIPAAHASVNLQILKAGKHAYCEKPFSLSLAEGKKVLAEAKKRKLFVGCAPDTVLGSGIQTCRDAIDKGLIGKPIAAVATMMGHGVESWHPNPFFYYQKGGGPLFDMGPYYLSSLITLLGPAKKVVGTASASFKERIITYEPLKGQKIKVEIPTHLSGIVEFKQGTFATINMSFDVWKHNLPFIEIYGTEGSLKCPDPNRFDGVVEVYTPSTKAWTPVPMIPSYEQQGRGLGLAEMAEAILKGRTPRANGELAYHVVDIMESWHVAAKKGKAVTLKTTCKRPEALTRKPSLSDAAPASSSASAPVPA